MFAQVTFRRAIAAAALLLGGLWLGLFTIIGEVHAENECKLTEKITRNIKLKADCTYTGTARIQTSGVTLDCNGANIDARGEPNAIVISGAGIHNVTIKNCIIFNADDAGVRIRDPMREPEVEKLPLDERYARGPHNIRILDTTVRDIHRVGIYVHNYAQDILIDNLTMDDIGGAGIYLDASSVRTTIQNSHFKNIGFGWLLDLRFGPNRREAIAIDSSAYNTIRGNRFENIANGAIHLYKNCEEKIMERKYTYERWQPSERNIIENNNFMDSDKGVWIASRQSRDLSSWDCGDKYYSDRFVIDRAPNNIVRGNSFKNVNIAIRVEDDDNIIRDNTISAEDACVWVGSEKRTVFLNLPVVGTTVVGNSCNTDGKAYRFTNSAQPKKFVNNDENGASARLPSR
jgi:Right handed beta helix region